MEKIVLFDPGIRSLNKGDEIIMQSAEYELADIIKDKYVIKSATHAPIVTWYQNTNLNPRMRIYHEAQYKFICGSNLIWKNMFKPRPVFNIDLTNCLPYSNSILFGIGIGQVDNKTNLYTKLLYKKILSKDIIHSVRDDAAAEFVRSLGYKAINTGCPTMWRFTPEFCKGIPIKKSNNVIFTLTDYGKEKNFDQKMIDILVSNYNKVYFWIQGVFDKEYFDTFENTKDIIVVPPTIEAYSNILKQDDIEYVGTRLHAGMFAMQHKRRAVLIAIDNRVRDMQLSYDLHVIERSKIDELESYINREFVTDIKIKQENINIWMKQFIN